NLLRRSPLIALLSTTCILSGCGNVSTTAPPSVAPTATTTTLTVSPNPASSGATVAATATVTATSSVAVDIVTFMDGSTVLGTATLSPTGANQSQAVFNITTFVSNSSHTITAKFNGDGIHSG